ncbi:MAG: O-antigen ligase family protein [Planctomycetota bacterium]
MSSVLSPWTEADRERTRVRVLGVSAGVAAAGLAVALQGNVVLTLVAASAATFFGLAFWRPLAALALLVSLVMFFEQYHIAGIESVTASSPLYLNLNNLTSVYLPANPLEILLATITLAFGLRWMFVERTKLRWFWPQWATLLFAASLIFTFGRGWLRGGELKVALWEVRAFFYLILLQFLIPQLVRRRRDIWIMVAAITVPMVLKSVQGLYRYFVTIEGRIDHVPAITSHECAFFLLCQFFLIAALWVYRTAPMLRWLLTLSLPMTLATFVLAQRRVAYGAMAIGGVLFLLLAPRAVRRRLAIAAVPVLLVLGLYTLAVWNKPYGTLSMPVRQVRSIFDPKPGSHEERSNDFRDIERFNLKTTIRAHLALGTGFGLEFYQTRPLPHINYPLYRFIPHNAILWLWAKSGTLGFLIFWFFIGANVVAALTLRERLRDPLARAVALTAALGLMLQTIISYYDLQLTFYRNMVFHGVWLGLVAGAAKLIPTDDASAGETLR